MWGHWPRGGGGGERGGRGAPRGPPRGPNFQEPSGLNPRRRPSPAFSHRGDQSGGRGATVAPGGLPGRGRRGANPGAGTAAPGTILTTRRGRAAQTERQQRPQGSGVQGGHLLGRLLLLRSRLGRSTWGGGSLTEEPPLSPLLLRPLRRPASRCVRPAAQAHRFHTLRTPRQPFRGRRPKFGCNFLEGAALVCPSASAASSHRRPRPPPPWPGRAAASTPGFPAGRSAGPSRARRDLRRVPGLAGPRRPRRAVTGGFVPGLAPASVAAASTPDFRHRAY